MLSVSRFLAKLLLLFIKQENNSIFVDQKRPLCGSFYIEQLDNDGDLVVQHVSVRYLVMKKGALYLQGWCQTLPRYNCIPVERIKQLADERGDTVISSQELHDWLQKRSLQ